MILGIDFDNTIISYDEIFHREAVKRKYIASVTPKNKKVIRDLIRQLPDGENKWQQLQVYVYGKAIGKAALIGGVRNVIKVCRRAKTEVYIVSHKSQFETLGTERVNLRQAAIDWMKKNRFFEKQGLGLTQNRVFFESTREGKINRIKDLHCTHFIDDLEETFLERTFPQNVEKILYAPLMEESRLNDATIVRSWEEISKELLAVQQEDEQMRAILKTLLKEPVDQLKRLKGGLNSRVYALSVNGRPKYALKHYFSDDPKRAARLTQEYNGLKFLYEHGIRNIPKPVIVNKKASCAVYEFINGEPIKGAVSAQDIDAALDFLKALKKLDALRESRALPEASEACFSINEIMQNIQSRLSRLKRLKGKGREFQAMKVFLKNEFEPFLGEIKSWLQDQSEQNDIDLEILIAKERRTLSPSDFGFHNCLRTKSGIVFLDFEHFGWDDPAKMIGDFLLHPAMALSAENKAYFVKKALNIFQDDKQLPHRIGMTYPLFALKWCLIFLNEFVKGDMKRRKFAMKDASDHSRILEGQLDKSRQMLKRIRSTYKDLPYGR